MFTKLSNLSMHVFTLQIKQNEAKSKKALSPGGSTFTVYVKKLWISLNGILISYGMPVSGQNFLQNMALEVTEN